LRYEQTGGVCGEGGKKKHLGRPPPGSRDFNAKQSLRKSDSRHYRRKKKVPQERQKKLVAPKNYPRFGGNEKDTYAAKESQLFNFGALGPSFGEPTKGGEVPKLSA